MLIKSAMQNRMHIYYVVSGSTLFNSGFTESCEAASNERKWEKWSKKKENYTDC